MYILDIRLPSFASELTLTELSFHFITVCWQQKSWTEMWKATFSSKYETGLCASLRPRNSCESPAAACAVPAGQAESAPWHWTQEKFSHKAASGEEWQRHLFHTTPQLQLMWLCPCSHGVKARKESSLQHHYQKMVINSITKEPVWPKCERIDLACRLKWKLTNP